MDFLEFFAISSLNETAGAKEFHEQSHIIPCKEEHERECDKVSQRPPDADCAPQDAGRHKHTQWNGHQRTHRYPEGAYEHMYHSWNDVVSLAYSHYKRIID